MKNSRRWLWRGLAIVGALIVVCIITLYVWVQRNTNFAGWQGEGIVADVQVPDGFQVNVFAGGLNGPRFIAVGPDGTLYAADRGNNRIVALPDWDNDHEADEIQVFAEGLNRPHSLVYHEGAWYVGVPSGVVRLVDEDGDGTADSQTEIISDYPTSGAHTTRTVTFLPDGRMVVSIGSSCNVCEEEDPRRAGVVVYDDATGANEQIFATGLRNAVGLTVHPETGELWATNNGRDLLGDDLPPETVYLVQEGANYGWPFCHNGWLEDPDMGFEGSCEGIPTPEVEMQAHSAPLGLAFYTGHTFPAEYQGDLFVAFHGSWNRTELTGYKVVHIPFANGQVAGELTDFAWGWLDMATDEVYGRPVGLAVGPDGALYVSDDKGGFIYRISYVGD